MNKQDREVRKSTKANCDYTCAPRHSYQQFILIHQLPHMLYLFSTVKYDFSIASKTLWKIEHYFVP